MHEPERIELAGGTHLIITWDDGRVDRMTAEMLRSVCPCASCRNAAPRPALSITPNAGLTNVSMVGAYAINLTFSPDGHATGIYPFVLLRNLGQAAESGRQENDRAG